MVINRSASRRWWVCGSADVLAVQASGFLLDSTRQLGLIKLLTQAAQQLKMQHLMLEVEGEMPAQAGGGPH